MGRRVLILIAVLAALAAAPSAYADFDYSEQPVGTFLPLEQGSCPTTTFCVIPSGGGDMFTSTDPAAGSWNGKNVGYGGVINSVSCPSTSLCVGVDESGAVITSTNPSAGTPAGSAATWTITTIAPGRDLRGISCPTATLCVVVNDYGQVYTSTNPTGGSAAWSAPFGTGVSGSFYHVDCPSTTLCVATDLAGEVAVSQNPTAGTGAWGALHIDGASAIYTVDCVNGNNFFCVVGDLDGNVLASNNPTVAGSWHATDLATGTNDGVFGVSCPSTSLCLAADNAGTIWTSTNPLANPAVWNGTKTQASHFDAIACPSTTLCVASTNDGSVVTATPAKPAVLTFFADNVTASSARLHGSVDPKGFAVTTCVFDLGTSAGSYQASRNCAQSPGSGSGAVPVSADLSGLPQNTTVHFRLRATNANGTNTGIDQTFTTQTAFTEVRNTQRPQISGTPQTGSQLSCTNGTWTNTDSNSSYSITWERGLRSATTDDDPSWHAINGASGSNYTVQQADEGSRVRCHVVATSQGISGEASSVSKRTDAGLPANTEAPTITGNPLAYAHNTLTCHPGTWTNSPDLTYQWTRSGAGTIPGATGPTYKLTPTRDDQGHVIDPNGDGDHVIGCQVTGTNDLGSSTSAHVDGPLAVDGPPWPVERPHLTSTRDDPNDDNPVKQVLNCSNGRWYDDYAVSGVDPAYHYEYQWYRNGAPIAGATQSSYRPTSDDYGREMTCVVTNSNPAGSRAGPADNPTVVALPHGTTDTEIYREGGRNPADPTNLMAISHDYLNAVNDTVIGRLKVGIDSATSECKAKIKSNGWPSSYSDHPATIPDEKTRCLILVYEPSLVIPLLDGGVRYYNGYCSPGEVPPNIPVQRCPSLEIQVAPIDPLRPPAQDQELLQKLAAVSPKEILWDLDGNGTTDARCPGSAPVLRTIFQWNRAWHPRAVILNQDDVPAHFGDISWDTADGSPRTKVEGALRDTQVKVCSVSFDPPPDKKLPCITSGDIGRIHIANANLCPIDERAINPTDFAQLLSGDTQGYLQAISESRLSGEGTATQKRAAPGIGTKWVLWDDGPATPQSTRRKSGGFIATFHGPVPASEFKNLGSTLDNTTAALTARNSPGSYLKPAAKFVTRVNTLTSQYNAANDGFAYNQIYVARGGDGSYSGSLDVNGVTMKALGDTAALLVPTDIKQALPNVHVMSLVGRDVSSYLGPAIQDQGIPLAVGGPLTSQLKEAATTEGGELLRQTNLNQMLTDAADPKKVVGGSAAFAAQLKKLLDVKPFSFFGESTVKAEKDGTATLVAHAELPGLTGGSSKDKLGAEVTVHADLEGHIKLEGIHLHAANAFLGGMKLADVDVNYNRSTGAAITGKVTFPQLGGQGVDIKRFALGPDGEFRELNLDYLAGAGQGIPLGQGVLLTTLGADLNIAQDIFAAHVVVSAGTSTGQGCPSLGADGKMTVSLRQPFYLDANVDLLLTCIKLGNIHFRVDQTGAIQLDGNWKFDKGPIYIDAGLGAKFHYPDWEVWADGAGGIRHLLQGEVHAVLSNIGLAGCGSVNVDVPIFDNFWKLITGHKTIHVSGGASVDFIKGRPPLNELEIINNLSLFTGCDVGRYYSLGHGRIVAHRAAAGQTALAVPPHMGPTLLSIEGAGAAPQVKLHSPSGQVLDFTDATGDTGKRLPGDAGWGTVIENEDRTVVILPRPKAGSWTLETAPGSPAVSRVRLAPILTPAAIKAHVSGHGTHRVLSYVIPKLNGQTVRFSEAAPGGLKTLKTIKGGGKGRFNYTVGDATGTKRVVTADFFLNGRPRKRFVVARYNAKSPAVGKVRHLNVRRRGRGAVVTWGNAALAATYLVRVDYGSGDRIALTPKRGARSVNVPSVRPGEGLRIRVTASSASGRRGPVATTVLKGSMRLGSIKRLPPYKPPKHRHKKHKPKRHKH